MTYCTVVEFEWDGNFDHEGFRRTLGRLSEESPSPAGLLSRITGIDASGARVIEVWRSGDDAQAFAKQAGPLLATVPMPAPARVTGFEVTSYEVA
jgi:hypothetical protein